MTRATIFSRSAIRKGDAAPGSSTTNSERNKGWVGCEAPMLWALVCALYCGLSADYCTWQVTLIAPTMSFKNTLERTAQSLLALKHARKSTKIWTCQFCQRRGLTTSHNWIRSNSRISTVFGALVTVGFASTAYGVYVISQHWHPRELK